LADAAAAASEGLAAAQGDAARELSAELTAGDDRLQLEAGLRLGRGAPAGEDVVGGWETVNQGGVRMCQK
jgi:hypothetical protein